MDSPRQLADDELGALEDGAECDEPLEGQEDAEEEAAESDPEVASEEESVDEELPACQDSGLSKKTLIMGETDSPAADEFEPHPYDDLSDFEPVEPAPQEPVKEDAFKARVAAGVDGSVSEILEALAQDTQVGRLLGFV